MSSENDQKTYEILVESKIASIRGSQDNSQNQMLSKKIVTISASIINDSLKKILTNLDETLSIASSSLKNFRLGETKVKLAISGNGELSFIGFGKTGVESSATLEITLEPNSYKNEQ